MKRILQCVLLSAYLIASSGCSTARTILATKDEKFRQLQETVTKFHKAVYWGDMAAASENCSTKVLGDLRPTVLGSGSSGRLVEVRADKFTQDPANDNIAVVEAKISYFGAPSLTVLTETREEQWAFDRLEGWTLQGSELLSRTKAAETNSLGGMMRQ